MWKSNFYESTSNFCIAERFVKGNGGLASMKYHFQKSLLLCKSLRVFHHLLADSLPLNALSHGHLPHLNIAIFNWL